MKILFLQDEIYLPSFAGGIKANRRLLEGLSRLGHECMALTPALTKSPDGPRTESEFLKAMDSRAIEVAAPEPRVFSYRYGGVHVDAYKRTSMNQWGRHLRRRIEAFQPDWLLVADDKRTVMLDIAMTTAASERIVLVLQTIVSLPFGPLAIEKSNRQSELMAKARAVIVISNFMKQYIDTYGKIQSHLMHLPVYGEGPFPKLARRDNRFVTMINPCEIKGAPIFLALARQFSDVQFAAVPTWGADRQLLDDLTDLPNVCLLEPTDDIDQILAQTRVLLAPSLWPESFGYVVPEAMLRGVPVLASNIGGLPEAKLGVEYLIPVLPAFRNGNGYVCPPQDIAPWSSALGKLLADPDLYARCSYASREAALSFVARIDTRRFERFLCELG